MQGKGGGAVKQGGRINNTDLNDLKKLFVRENLKFLLKEFQFVMSLKILRSMAYTICHAPIPMTSY